MNDRRISAHPAAALVAATLMLGACAGEPRDADAPGGADVSAQIAAVEALSTDSILATVPTTATARARFEALSDSLDRSPEHERAPLWLWEAGIIGRDALSDFLNSIDRRSPDTVYVLRRPQVFWYNEVGGSYIYTGWHFEELVRRFPRHPLADDASFADAEVGQGGECEGSFACYMHRWTGRYADFLHAYPASRHVKAAVDTVNKRLLYLFAAFDTGSMDFSPRYENDVEVTDSALVRYTAATTLLQPPVRARAYRTLANLLARWGMETRAAALYQALLGELAPYVSDSAVVRLESRTRYAPMRERVPGPAAKRAK